MAIISCLQQRKKKLKSFRRLPMQDIFLNIAPNLKNTIISTGSDVKEKYYEKVMHLKNTRKIPVQCR